MAAVVTAVQPRTLTAEPHGARARREARAGLYVHVPFCASACGYCDFASGHVSREALERWLAGVAREADLRAPEAAELRFTSVFFGGGTPSLLPPRAFRATVERLRAAFRIEPDAEFTLEANPESVRPALLAAWREGGVNRLSLGAQSFDPGELRALGRIHSADTADAAVRAALGAGFARVSLDLMFGFPGHGIPTWERSIARALESGIEHLSAYAFIPEPGTPLGNATLRGEARVPDSDGLADLHDALLARADAAGFDAYETSNFARPEAECRHNLVYWLRRPYVGLGPSAHGFVRGFRYGNAYAFEQWAARVERGELPEASREAESDESAAREILMLGLRLDAGVAFADYSTAEITALRTRYAAAIDAAVRGGRLERTADGWRIARRHRFVADDVIAWIEARAERGLTARAASS